MENLGNSGHRYRPTSSRFSHKCRTPSEVRSITCFDLALPDNSTGCPGAGVTTAPGCRAQSVQCCWNRRSGVSRSKRNARSLIGWPSSNLSTNLRKQLAQGRRYNYPRETRSDASRLTAGVRLLAVRARPPFASHRANCYQTDVKTRTAAPRAFRTHLEIKDVEIKMLVRQA